MKIAITVQAADVLITNDAGATVLEYSVKESAFTLDLATGLNAFSELAHLFKALDKTHRAEAETFTKPVSARDRSPKVQELIDAVRRYKTRTNGVSVELSSEQHDGYMALADALSNVCDDASEHNVRVLADRAKAYIALFTADQFSVVRSRLIQAIAAV